MAEKKYIELKKALNVCEMHYQHCLEMHDWSGDTNANNIMRDIETIPTADVVEVKCRCSECKHLKIINKEPVYAECERQKLTFLLWEADTREHSCSYGERK